MKGAELRSSGNRLLAKVPAGDLDPLAAAAERVTLERYTPLIKPNTPIRDAWFPINCLASLVTVLADGSTVEAGSVGQEGMVGVPFILGETSTPMETVVQVPGDAIRIPAARVKEVFDRGGSFRQLLNRYTHTLFIVASQSAACNRRHRIEARFARWLLMSADGIGSDEIGITHEFLATMLGVRRSSVTDAALSLQQQGLIDYRRASVRIVQRRKLATVACECYGIVRQHFEKLQ